MRRKTCGDERGRVSASAGSGARRCKAEAARVEKARRRAKASLAIAQAKLQTRSYRGSLPFFRTISALTKEQPVSTVKILSCGNRFRMREVVRATFGLRCHSPRRPNRRQEPSRHKRAERAKLRQVCRSPSR